MTDEAFTDDPPATTDHAEGAPDQTYGDELIQPKLLDPATDARRVVQYLHDQWIAQKDKYARPILEYEVNKRRRNGEDNVWVEKISNQAIYRIYESHGGGKLSQFYQVADRLASRMVDVLHVDPPEPNAVPMTGESEDRDAAEFASRVLVDVGSESGLNALEAHKIAFDWAGNGGSAYIWTYTDPTGGGLQPIEVDAHPMAQHVDQAMMDPMTGMPHKGETATKFVGPDGSLGDDRAAAATRWVPKLAREVVEFPSVRLLPHTALDLWDANGLLYAKYHTWGTLVNWFPVLKNLPTEERDQTIKFRLPEARDLLPKKGNRPHDPAPKAGHEDDGLALLMIKWCVQSPEYPEGAYIVTIGDRICPPELRFTWSLEGPNGKERRDLPFTQVMQFRGDPDNPVGRGIMHFLGPSNENLGEVKGRMYDMLDKLLNPINLIPFGSTIQPEDFDNPLNSTLYFQPGFEPKRFEGPKIPAEAFKFVEDAKADMRDATGMGQASAEGLEASNVQSGRHALAIQATQQASLAGLNQNINRAFVRDWRIQLQAIRADYDVPQLLRYVDKDGGYKVQRWLGSDLSSVRDVQIKRGTGTLFNPAQKAQYLTEYAQVTGADPADIKDLVASGFSPYTNIQDDEFLMRVRRQLSQWEQGPPPGWPPPVEPQVLGVDPMGQPIMGPPPVPPDPVFAMDQRPIDMASVAAQTRIREIGKAMAGTKYGKMPPPWKNALNQEFARMQQALAPPPMPAGPPGKPGVPPKPSGEEPGQPPSLTTMEQGVLGPSVTQPAGGVAP